MSSSIPTTGTRTTLESYLKTFLHQNSHLHVGGTGDFHEERNHYTQFVEFTAIRGPHGTIPIRVLYPSSRRQQRNNEEAAALIYFHGGAYTVDTVDDFENGLRIVAEEAGMQMYAVEYRLAHEWRFPTQLDEYACVLQWLQGEGGKARGVHPDKVCGGGDSTVGNMTAALSLRLRDGSLQMITRCLPMT